MSCFPPPRPREGFCRRCGFRLNHYGVCPNQQKHHDDDAKRHSEYQTDKEQKQQYFDSLLDSVFNGKPLPPIFSELHKHVWEPWGDDKLVCKIAGCGKVVFRKDLR